MTATSTNQIVRPLDVSLSVPHNANDGVRTLRRGLQLLDAVVRCGEEGARVVDLCRMVNLERATVHRLLATLQEAGYVVALRRFRYVASPRLTCGSHGLLMSNLAVQLQPILERISTASGDAVFAVVREGTQSHCIARQVGTHPVQVLAIQVGTHQPLGVGAAGLALLSALPDEQVNAVLAMNAGELPRYGGMTLERMALLIRATRERGWSIIGNHASRNVLGVGMVVRNKRTLPVAAISVASTVERMPKSRVNWIAKEMQEAIGRLLPTGL